MEIETLAAFIVLAKRATYVGSGTHAESSRLGSHDLVFTSDRFSYRDSYFGGTDFIGQEVVWHDNVPTWSMSYYGYVVRADLIDAARAGATIKAALTALYAQGRFLGGFDWIGPHGVYRDRSHGDVARFRGRETISVGNVEAYALDYFGGVIKP
jgi:hypothetical protein